jgi:glycosyltransferase involved in cell wall biosynthesis
MRDLGIPAGRVSVLIAVRDGAAYIEEAIESALAQSYRPIEVVVVDDGSRDATAEVVRRYGSAVVYARQRPLGIGAARNRAVELSSGELLAFLDADDLFEPGRIRRQTDALAHDPDLEAVFGRVTEFVQPGIPARSRDVLRQPRDRAPSHLVTAMLIRRSAFERVGPFDTDLVRNVTVEWYSRALDAGLRSVTLEDVVLRRRLHGANVGVRRWDGGHELVAIARAALERRRISGSA